MPTKAAKPAANNKAAQTTSLTKRQAAEMYAALDSMGNTVSKPKFAFTAAINKRALKPYHDALAEARKLPPVAEEYEKARSELVRLYAEKDEAGNVVVLANGNARLKDSAGFEAGLTELQDKHPDAVKAMKDRADEIEKLLTEPAGEIKFATCPLDVVPDLPAGIVDAILPMLTESDGGATG